MRSATIAKLLWKRLPFRRPRLAMRQIPMYIRFFNELEEFRRLSDPAVSPPITLEPVITDKIGCSGALTYHYFFQDLWMAQQVLDLRPTRLVDIGSRIDGFVAHVAAFRSIEVLDIRPLPVRIPNVAFHQMDLMQGPAGFRGATDAVSCLHVLEHFGLGRYGDPINPMGHIIGLQAIYEMLTPAGFFFFSTIIGSDTIQFNAHRIFSLRTLLDLFRGRFEVLRFAIVNDANELIDNVSLTEAVITGNAGQDFGCGLFVLRKIQSDLQ